MSKVKKQNTAEVEKAWETHGGLQDQGGTTVGSSTVRGR